MRKRNWRTYHTNTIWTEMYSHVSLKEITWNQPLYYGVHCTANWIYAIFLFGVLQYRKKHGIIFLIVSCHFGQIFHLRTSTLWRTLIIIVWRPLCLLPLLAKLCEIDSFESQHKNERNWPNFSADLRTNNNFFELRCIFVIFREINPFGFDSN